MRSAIPRQARVRWCVAFAVGVIAAHSLPPTARAQINVLAPTFNSLNGAAVWASSGFTAGEGATSDRRPQWRWGFAAFYGPFGGRGDTLVTFTRNVSDSSEATSPDSSATGSSHARQRVRTERMIHGDSKRLGGGKVTLAAGYQHSAFYRFGTPGFPGAVPVGGIFVATLLGPYPLPLPSARLGWYGGVGGTIVRLSDLALRADTVATALTTERTFAPEAMLMLMYNVAPSYRVILGASYQYLRFGSVSYRATQAGDRIPASVLAGLPQELELRSVHLSLGFSFAAAGLIPAH